jgi:hypothetical protein
VVEYPSEVTSIVLSGGQVRASKPCAEPMNRISGYGLQHIGAYLGIGLYDRNVQKTHSSRHDPYPSLLARLMYELRPAGQNGFRASMQTRAARTTGFIGFVVENSPIQSVVGASSGCTQVSRRTCGRDLLFGCGQKLLHGHSRF